MTTLEHLYAKVRQIGGKSGNWMRWAVDGQVGEEAKECSLAHIQHFSFRIAWYRAEACMRPSRGDSQPASHLVQSGDG